MARRTLQTLFLGLPISVLALSVLEACASDDGDGPSDACADSSTLRYESFGAPFVTTYCVGCHGASVTSSDRQGAPTDEVFDTVAQIRTRSSYMVSVVSVQKSMPYGSASPKPTEEERQQFAEWLACGAPE